MTRTMIRLTVTADPRETMTLRKIVPMQTAAFRPLPSYIATDRNGQAVEMSRAEVKAMLREMAGQLTLARVGR